MNDRDICFSQGKAYVYRLDPPDSDIIRTEWPNGVIDDHRIGENTCTRRWPDNKVETVRKPASYPEWPTPKTTTKAA